MTKGRALRPAFSLRRKRHFSSTGRRSDADGSEKTAAPRRFLPPRQTPARIYPVAPPDNPLNQNRYFLCDNLRTV
jgi:hypothetical protein